MSDVVSRLLAAIDERERQHRALAEALETVTSWGGKVDAAAYIRTTVREGLPLCQAHRDIVAEWAKRKQMADQLAAERYVGDAVIAAEAIVAALWAAVTLLARGYGVEDGETK